MKHDPASIADLLQNGHPLCAEELHLNMGGCTLRLRSNAVELITGLRNYISHVLAENTQADIEVIAIDREAPELGLEFTDWKREPGKTGRKDSYVELQAGRLIRKVRTGMVFLQSANRRIAAGPCLKYDNQVINFINAQYMNWLQHRGWLICHAAGLAHNGKGFAIAGFSGGGKSTLMLNLLEHDAVSYLSNDRLFIRKSSGMTRAVGIPKLPRVNPGTIVHNPRLQNLIDSQQREQLLRLPPEKLWHLEEKYDVHIDRIYGPGRIVAEAPLAGFLVLNWQRDVTTDTGLAEVELLQRPDLLGTIMKSPGPFYQYPDGSFYQDDTDFDPQAYLDALQGVRILEVTGRVDFPALTGLCLDEIMI